jgi:hypothetical protein
VVKNRAVCIQPIGVMTLTSGISGNGPALTGVFLTLTALESEGLGAEGELFSVAIRFKLEGRQKWR